VGREFLWGLLQLIVCGSAFVCLSLRREPLRGEVRLVCGPGERGLSLERRGGEGRKARFPPPPSSSAYSPREFQALLILGPGQAATAHKGPCLLARQNLGSPLEDYSLTLSP
jgi:hypothetical protein